MTVTVSISFTVALKSAVLSEVSKLSFCQSQSRVTSDEQSRRPLAMHPQTNHVGFLSDDEFQVFRKLNTHLRSYTFQIPASCTRTGVYSS